MVLKLSVTQPHCEQSSIQFISNSPWAVAWRKGRSPPPRHALVGGELDRIDAKESIVLAGPDERFEARDDARAPGVGRFQGAEPIFQELLVDRGCHSTLSF